MTELKPLSQNQMSLYLKAARHPTASVFNLTGGCCFADDPELRSQLESAIPRLLARHQVLTTRLYQKADDILQGFGSSDQQIEVIDCRQEPYRSNHPILRTLGNRPFDLFNEPLAKFYFIEFAAGEFAVFFVIHHLICDAWSMELMVRDLAEFCGGSPVARKGSSYQDYLDLDLAYQTSGRSEQDRLFWQESLRGFEPGPQLQTNRIPGAAIEAAPSVKVSLSTELSERVQAKAREMNTTVSNFLLSALFVTLGKFSGKDDVAIFLPVFGRSTRFKNAVGYFARGLPIRARLADLASFDQLCKETQAGTFAAMMHQDFAVKNMKQLYGEGPVQEISNVMFSFQKGSLAGADESFNRTILGEEQVDIFVGRPGRTIALQDRQAQFDLDFYVGSLQDRLILYALFNERMFSRSFVENFCESFAEVLRSVVENVSQCVGSIGFLPAKARHKLTVDFNATAQPYPLDRPLQSWFEAQARLQPAAIALIDGDRTLTYAELNHLAEAHAHHLLVAGLQPGMAVGIHLERSWQFFVAIYAALKAGGAFVPLDPGLPAERLRTMCEAARISLVFTKDGNGLDGTLPLQQLTIRSDASGTVQGKTFVSPKQPAYILFTSGTTGTPKGASLPHEGIVNRLLWMQEAYPLTQDDTVFHKTPTTFDVSVWELFWPLMVGSRVLIAKPEGHKDPRYLADSMVRHDVSVVHFVPSMLDIFLRDATAFRLSRLRLTFASGEALTQNLANRFHAAFPHCALHNLYGPTEASIDVSFHEALPQEDTHQTVPIGRPISNTQLYVLDRNFQPVPEGVTGELYIGGVNLALGYSSRPGMTAERFLPNPLLAGQRIYRTGDLVRMHSKGYIEYLGRNDSMVKINGNRIELGEIDSQLSACPGIESSVTVVDQAEGRGPRLLAYYTSQSMQPLDEAALRLHLSKFLPSYMIPGLYMHVREFAMTANGKLDRKQLPAPDRPAGASRSAVIETPTERYVAAHWQSLLNVSELDRADDFFSLGGDSLASIKLQSRLRQDGYALELAQIYEHPQLEQLASLLDSLSPSRGVAVVDSWTPFAGLDDRDRRAMPDSVENAFPLSELQIGMVFHSHFESAAEATYHDIFSYGLQAIWDEGLAREAVTQLQTRHAVLRSRFDLTSYSKPVQIIERDMAPTILIRDDREDLSDWLTTEQGQGFDLSQGPLIRFVFHRQNAQHFILSLSFHHAILDGLSVATLLTEFCRLYSAALLGEKVALHPLTDSFARYWQLEKAALARPQVLDFWKNWLQNQDAARLPDRNLAGLRSVSETRLLSITDAESQQFKELASRWQVAPKTLALALHLYAVSQLIGKPHPLSGIVVHGRDEKASMEGTLGLYVNTLPFHLEIQPQDSWKDLVQRVFQLEKNLLDQHRVPLNAIQKVWGQEQPFDFLFNFINFRVEQDRLSLPNLQLCNAKIFEQTNYPCVTHFRIDSDSDKLEIRLNLNRAVISEQLADGIVQIYQKGLQHLLQHTSQLIQTASLFDREQVMVEARAEPICEDQLIPNRIAAMIQKYPENVALRWEGKGETYAQLGVDSDRLAALFAARGVKRGDRIVLCLHRSPLLIKAILAVLKCGAAYVPIDPAAPAQRVQYILSDCGADLIVTERSLAAELEYSDRHLLIDDQDESTPVAEFPRRFISGHDTAYIIYTSGSTGRPKGVAVSHHNLARLFVSCARVFSFDADDCWTLFHSAAFDFSVWEIFGALCHGAKLVIVPYLVSRDPQAFLRVLMQEKVTVLNQTPTAFRQLIAALPASFKPASLPLRYVVFGGEKLLRSMLEPWLDIFGEDQPQLINMYGITETTVHVTFHRVALEDPMDRSIIGFPLADLGMVILDAFMNPVAPGVFGELFVSGEGLSPGYINQPALTAQRFIPDPFSTRGGRLYRTGDVVRLLAKGGFEYRDRCDNQVQWKGFRIELSEIEAAFNSLSEVIQSRAILYQENAGADPQLVAFVEGDSQSLTLSRLREHLRLFLPTYMLPTRILIHDEFPTNTNGKVDFLALLKQAPVPEIVPSEDDDQGLESAEEQAILPIFAQLLNMPQIGRRQSFFEWGGDSLAAVRAVALINDKLQVQLSIRDLFEQATAQNLAALIQEKSGHFPKFEWSSDPHRSGDYPATRGQQEMWFLQKLQPKSYQYHMPGAIYIRGPFDADRFRTALQQVVDRQPALRTKFAMERGRLKQCVASQASIQIEVHAVEGLSTDQARKTVVLQHAQSLVQKPFDLKQDVPYRVALLRFDENTHGFVIVMHHIIADGWSIDIFTQDLQRAMRGETLAPLAMDLVDFAAWQQSSAYERQQLECRDYWEKALLVDAVVAPVKADFTKQNIKLSATLRQSLPADMGSKIVDATRKIQVTPSQFFQTILSLTLARLADEPEVVFGMATAHRPFPQILDTMGYFIQTVPLYCAINSDQTFPALVRQVAQQSADALAHNQLPFSDIVAIHRKKTGQSQGSPFEVYYNFMEIRETEFESIEVPLVEAKFDWTLQVCKLGEDRFEVHLEYDAHRFSSSTAQAFFQTYLSIMTAAVSSDDATVAQLLSSQ